MSYIAYTETAPLAATSGTTPAPQENIFASLLPFAFIFVIFYFLIIRPQQKKFKQHQAMVQSIKKGDKVVLASGIIGKVTKADTTDPVVEVEIAEGVTVKVVASTISSVDAKDKISNDNNKKAA